MSYLAATSGSIISDVCLRGASGSAGKTSWTGKPELGDYVSVYGFALCYINAIYHPVEVSSPLPRCSDALLILGGYSYGSMIASHLPPRDQVVELFRAPASDSAENEIKLRAEDLSRDARAYLDMHTSVPTTSLSINRGRGSKADETSRHSHRAVAMGGYESEVAGRRVSRESSRRSLDGERVRQSIDNVRRKISHHRVVSPKKSPLKPQVPPDDVPTVPRIAYILISPLLPPIAGFTTMFSKLHFTKRNGGSHVAATSSGLEFEELTSHPCMCIYGCKDAFTSDRKLQRWTENLSSRPSSQFVAIRTDSGHFWHDSDGITRLQHGLADWVKTVVPSSNGEGRTEEGGDSLDENARGQ